ncbi:ApeP family dehydratase [Aliidiomarina indica]|uniref:ApeP family dehydratase n=1 Tax=Aliidiomarina indica TaxID=2749147 RepID=UPI00188DD303|nr:3-hydroxylacyl-ACP dehydratase [Aliidiomarina indica]
MNGLRVEDVIPHKASMVLLDELIDATSTGAFCQVHISPKSSFYTEVLDGVPAYIGLEYIAQTIAAYSGVVARQGGNSPQIGLLLGTRKYEPTKSHFSNGDILHVKADKLLEDSNGLSVFLGTIAVGTEDNVVVRAKINVFQPENAENWLQEKI